MKQFKKPDVSNGECEYSLMKQVAKDEIQYLSAVADDGEITLSKDKKAALRLCGFDAKLLAYTYHLWVIFAQNLNDNDASTLAAKVKPVLTEDECYEQIACMFKDDVKSAGSAKAIAVQFIKDSIDVAFHKDAANVLKCLVDIKFDERN